MILKFVLKYFNPNFVISFPSIIIFPLCGSIILNNAAANDDLPAPDLPTTPII